MKTLTLRLCILTALPLLVFTGPGRVAGSPSNQPMTNLWYVDGPVHAVVEANGVVYLGGEFHYAGPQTGGGVVVNASTGERDSAFPQVNGPVYAVVADGSGGWFIAGTFRQVGTVARSGLAHILNNGTVDATWDPSPTG